MNTNKLLQTAGLALAAVWLFSPRAAGTAVQNEGKDMEAIRRLHEKDMAAAKAGDVAALRTLMTDDAVVMPPDSQPLRGRQELAANFARQQKALAEMEVLEYVLDFQEVKIFGGHAYEWGQIRGRMRQKGSTAIVASTFNVMRILAKQPDGSWKVHRTIWNSATPLLQR